MDLKDIIIWSRRHWYLFVISLAVCGVLGCLYYYFTPPSREVRATIMLRQTNDKSASAQDEMLRMMGMGGQRIASDEIEILSSRTLMEQVVGRLGLRQICYKKGKRFWECQFPNNDITVLMPDSFSRNADIDIKISDEGKWKVKIKVLDFSTVKLTLNRAGEQMMTDFGPITFSASSPDISGHYRVEVRTLRSMVETLRKGIKISRLNKESNIIELTSVSSSPVLTSAIIDTQLDIYNRSYVSDKNLLAQQTEEFLSNRLSIIAADLDNAEMEVESYKRQYRIASISTAAESYRDYGEQYQRQVAEVNSEMDILDFISSQLNSPEKENTILPSNIGISDEALQDVILTYNNLILNRNKLRQTAYNDNPSIKSATEQIVETRRNLTEGIAQSRQSLALRRDYLQKQQQQYEQMLSSLPEQERRYIEMQRDKATKEKQYLYLVTKREENSMLLAAEATPAKIIDRAQTATQIESPNIKFIILLSLIIGLALPFAVYMYEALKKELL